MLSACELLALLILNIFDFDHFSHFYASAQHSVAGGIVVLSCSSGRACMRVSRNIVNTISCRVIDTFSPNLHQ